jgi:hypothetical protein
MTFLSSLVIGRGCATDPGLAVTVAMGNSLLKLTISPVFRALLYGSEGLVLDAFSQAAWDAADKLHHPGS